MKSKAPISCTCARCFNEPTRDDVIAATEPTPGEVAAALHTTIVIAEGDFEPTPLRPLTKVRS